MMRELLDSPRSDLSIKSDIIQFVLQGHDKFREDLISFWQNVGVVSALIGAIGISILLNPLSKTSFYAPSDDTVNVDNASAGFSIGLAQTYYAIWGVAAFSEIAAVIMVTILVIHLKLMISEYDTIWFVTNWSAVCHEFPQILLVIGCFSLIFGCCLGSFLIADITTGIIVSCVAVAAICVVLPTWLYMLNRNKARQLDTVKKFQSLVFELGNKV